MSAVNLGSQYITWDYKHPAKAADFNTLLKGGFPPGIYEGGSITKVDNTSVNVNPFIAYIQSGTDKIVKIETRATFTVEDLTPTNNVIYMTYPWSDVIDNWANFEVRAESDPPLTNEIVLGIAKYSGTILDHIDYSETPLGNIQRIINTEKELIYNLLGLSSTPSGVMILKGGEVSDAGSGNVNIAECYAVTEDDEGELRIIYVPTQSNVPMPSGWDDGRQIWVSTNYIKNGSYSVGSMFTDSAPISSRVVLDSFYMNGTTFAEQSGRSPVHEPRDNSVGLQHLTEALRDFLNNITPQYWNNLFKPSYKNLTIKSTAGSQTTSLDVDFDELQIGILREESYTPQSITLASDMDTGSAPTGGFLYVWVYAGIGQTTICKFSTSATTPATIAGYTETRCLTGLQVISGVLIGISQVNTSVAYSGGSTYTNADNDTINSLTLSNYLPMSMVKNYTVFVAIDSGTPGFNVYTENEAFGSGLDLLSGISYQTKSYFFQNIGDTFYSQRFPGTSGTFLVNFRQAELNI